MCKTTFYQDPEVQALHDEMYLDGTIDQAEANRLWEIKASKDVTSDDFDRFFAEAIMSNIMEDGEFSEEEAKDLIDRITADDTIDDAETCLLEMIVEKHEDGEITAPQCFIDAFPSYFEESEGFDDDEDEE